MTRFPPSITSIVAACSVIFSAALSIKGSEASISPLTWAVGYEEGLTFKLYVTNQIAGQVSIGYSAIGADTLRKVPINSLSAKIGGAYLLKNFSALRVNAFLDGFVVMNQDQLVYQQSTQQNPYNKRYNRFDFGGRLGLAPEFFLTDHLSITYKFGLQYTYYGSRFKLNADESGLESCKTDHSELSVYGWGTGPFQLLHNIGVLVYF
jgi:hypothetical protein